MALEERVPSPRGPSDGHSDELTLEDLSPSQASSSPLTVTDESKLCYLLPNIALMHPGVVKVLNCQGCFTIPDQHALDLFFGQYFLYIHPLFPIIDEVHFWEMHRSTSTLDLIISGQLSLHLLYGILYTSASYVPASLIQGLGFRNIHQAKEVFHMRAKLLYESPLERSPIAISQAALLLSHCYLTEPPRYLNNLAPMWLAIAIENAQKARAPEYNSMPVTAQPNTLENESQRQTLKRLWWTCIIRDRIMPLAARQCIRITRSTFDFESNPPLNASDFIEEIQHSPIYDWNIKTVLVQVLVKLLELCVILTDVLAVNYSLAKDDGHTVTQKAEQASRIRDCRVAMQVWYRSFIRLKLENQANPTDQGELNGSSEGFVVLFANEVIMYYHSAIIALCHQEILIFGSCSSSMVLTSGLAEDLQNRCEVQLATSRLVQCLMNVVRLRLAHILPLSVVGCAMFPLALQIIDLKLLSATNGHQSEYNSEADFLKQSQKHFIGVIEAMQMCRSRFPAVDWVLTCIRISVKWFYQLLFSNASSRNMKNILLPEAKSWTDILHRQPDLYLSLVTLMDFSLGSGQLPANDFFTRMKTMEFPKQISSNTFNYSILPESFSMCDIDILTRVQVHHNNLWNHKKEPVASADSQPEGVNPRVVKTNSPNDPRKSDYTTGTTVEENGHDLSFVS